MKYPGADVIANGGQGGRGWEWQSQADFRTNC